MKFPKLKHTFLCSVLLILPAFTVLWYLIVCALIFGDDGIGMATLIGLLFSMAFSLWYVFAHFSLLMSADVMFSSISSWKRDRLEYRTSRNGLDRADIERHILRRCRLWGRQYIPESVEAQQFRIFHRHGISVTVFYSVIEKRVVVCSVGHLTVENYRVLVDRVRSLLRQIPDKTPLFQSKESKKAPRAYASVFVILADKVDAEVCALARRTLSSGDNNSLLPCVVECSAGKYYFDGSRQYYSAGLEGRSAKNYASAVLQRIVFGGRLPLRDKSMRPHSEWEDKLDMSLWEFMREFRQAMRDSDVDENKEHKRMLRRMREGDICIGEYAVYIRSGDRIAAFDYITDEDDEKLITLSVEGCWHFYRKGKPPVLTRRKMKGTISDEFRRRAETWLLTEGYRLKQDE